MFQQLCVVGGEIVRLILFVHTFYVSKSLLYFRDLTCQTFLLINLRCIDFILLLQPPSNYSYGIRLVSSLAFCFSFDEDIHQGFQFTLTFTPSLSNNSSKQLFNSYFTWLPHVFFQTILLKTYQMTIWFYFIMFTPSHFFKHSFQWDISC